MASLTNTTTPGGTLSRDPPKADAGKHVRQLQRVPHPVAERGVGEGPTPLSPEGAKVCSQGRKPLGKKAVWPSSPSGATGSCSRMAQGFIPRCTAHHKVSRGGGGTRETPPGRSFAGDLGKAVLRAEDKMVVKAGEGLAHCRVSALSPLRGRLVFAAFVPGACAPGYRPVPLWGIRCLARAPRPSGGRGGAPVTR
jgi:hypothetical protein